MATPFTLIDADAGATPHAAETTADTGPGGIRIPIGALGYVRKPEGLCKGPVCHPIPDGAGLSEDGLIGLEELSELTGRPVAIDAEEGAAFVGVAAEQRGATLRALEAPDFTLPDLEGKPHSLSDHRGKKVLLVAYASW